MRNSLIVLLTGLLAPFVADARSFENVEFRPCTLAPAFVATSVDARCASIEVPEDHDDPDGRSIELALAWIPAREVAEPDAVFMLAGGPGQSARDSYPGIASAFNDVRRRRNILLLDQRGTGGSNPLVCQHEEDAEVAAAGNVVDPVRMRAAAERCRDALQARADLRFYTTSDAVRDLDFVRGKLELEQINLVAISYGTRVAQQYARRYPAHTRSLVLDGIVPNALALGSEHAANLEAALDLHFGLCRDTPGCHDRLGDPRSHLDALLALADSEEAPLARYRDPVTAQIREERLNRTHVLAVARMYAYSPLTAALLPLSLHEAANGRPDALVAQARMMIDNLSGQIHHGMQLSVVCSEDAPELARLAPERADSVLGPAMTEITRAQCEAWPSRERPADFREPLDGDVPALLVSGEFDPVTPPAYGEQVVAALPKGRHLVLAGQGHNVIGTGCVPKLMARFIDTLDAAELDAGCLDGLRPLPAFTGFHGWEP